MSQQPPLTPEECAALHRLTAERGALGLSREMGLHHGALTRALAGLPVRAGSLALIRLGLTALNASSTQEAS